MPHQIPLTASIVLLLLTACTQDSPRTEAQATPALERAGQPIDLLKTAGHITAVRLSALAGDQDGIGHNVEAMSDDMRRAMKLPDPNRPIDREAARDAVRSLQGVRSVVWLDRTHLLVRVEDVALRTQRTIDVVCTRLQPLGDTLGVVVHLQSATQRDIGDLDALKRNCQLAAGDASAFQVDRSLNALDPAIREQHRINSERARSQARREMSAEDRAALEAIPEM